MELGLTLSEYWTSSLIAGQQNLMYSKLRGSKELIYKKFEDKVLK